MENDDKPEAGYHKPEVYLKRISEEVKTIRTLLSEASFAQRDAEGEVTEKMRRFMMYMHDIHDITYMYETRGLTIPPWVKSEMERCDDRLRQLLEEEHAGDGTFAKVRAKMAEDPNNRWDHTRQLEKPKEQA